MANCTERNLFAFHGLVHLIWATLSWMMHSCTLCQSQTKLQSVLSARISALHQILRDRMDEENGSQSNVLITQENRGVDCLCWILHCAWVEGLRKGPLTQRMEIWTLSMHSQSLHEVQTSWSLEITMHVTHKKIENPSWRSASKLQITKKRDDAYAEASMQAIRDDKLRQA